MIAIFIPNLYREIPRGNESVENSVNKKVKQQ